ncbi:hypothetical protein [Burkholderia stagnalis]
MSADAFNNDELCSAALAVIGAIPTDSMHTAWVSGSLVEGLGNPSSDVDIFVALEGDYLSPDIPTTRRDTDHGIFAMVQDGVRYDVEFWTLKNIRLLGAKLCSLPIDDPKINNLHFLNYWETEFIHRLLIGVPLVNEDNFLKLRGEIDYRRFSRFLMDTAIRRCDDAFDDAIGMTRAGQIRMAALRAREALGFSVDALLHAHGVTNDKAKFRLAKLEKLNDVSPAFRMAMVEQFWTMQCGMPSDEEGLQRFVEKTLRQASDWTNAAQAEVRSSHEDIDGTPPKSILRS